MSASACACRDAVIVASSARLLLRSGVDRGGCTSGGSLRWCPECGSIRAELPHDMDEGITLGQWMRPGDADLMRDAAHHAALERRVAELAIEATDA